MMTSTVIGPQIITVVDAANRTPIGYPVAQPSGGTLNAPDPAQDGFRVPPIGA